MIYGIDLGVRSFHAFGVPTVDDGSLITVSHDLPRGRSRYLELRDMVLHLNEFISEADVVFVEEPPLAGAGNRRTFGHLNQSAGAILSATAAQGYLVPVDSWKKATVGKGGVDKQVVAGWLGLHHPSFHEQCDGNQNLVDAACIALYGQQLLDSIGGADRALPGDMDLPV